MNVHVVQGANNQISLFTSTGQQLVGGVASLATELQQCRHARRDRSVERQSKPGRRRHDHADRRPAAPKPIWSPSGAIQSGRNRRLSADARHHLAAGAEPARRDGEPDVAGVVEPDNERHRRQFRQPDRLRRRHQHIVGRQFAATHLYRPRKCPAHGHDRGARSGRFAAAADQSVQSEQSRSSGSISPAA